jgi:hypothetical protein
MFQAFRQFGPVLKVPAAWTTAILAVNTEILPDQGLLIAHIVMSVLMTVFLLTGWKQMKEGVLKAWRTVITIGLPVTVLGALGLMVYRKSFLRQSHCSAGCFYQVWHWCTQGRKTKVSEQVTQSQASFLY